MNSYFGIILIFFSLMGNIAHCEENKIKKLWKWYEEHFDNYDTCYVSKYKEHFAVQTISDNYMDFHDVAFLSGKNSFTIRMNSELQKNIGVSFSIRPITLAYYISDNNLNDNQIKKIRLRLSNSSIIINSEYFEDSGTRQLTKLDKTLNKTNLGDFDGMNFNNLKIEADYIFNHKEYSQGAAYSFSSKQKRSSGSFIGGLSYSYQNIEIDYSKLDKDLCALLCDSSIHKFKYTDYCVSIGYAKNFVIKDLVFNATIQPQIGLKYATEENKSKYLLALDPYTSLAMVYNKGMFFAATKVFFNYYINYNNHIALNNAIFNARLSCGIRF